MRQEQFYLIEDLYHEFNYAGGKFEGMGRAWEEDVDACDKVTGSTKYKATMVNADSYDSAYDENDEPYRYYVAGYYSADSNGHPYGLAESTYTNDLDDAVDIAWEYITHGDIIEIKNQITGNSLTWTPDEWDEDTFMDDINVYLV